MASPSHGAGESVSITKVITLTRHGEWHVGEFLQNRGQISHAVVLSVSSGIPGYWGHGDLPCRDYRRRGLSITRVNDRGAWFNFDKGDPLICQHRELGASWKYAEVAKFVYFVAHE
jgi:hypothetical protein